LSADGSTLESIVEIVCLWVLSWRLTVHGTNCVHFRLVQWLPSNCKTKTVERVPSHGRPRFPILLFPPHTVCKQTSHSIHCPGKCRSQLPRLNTIGPDLIWCRVRRAPASPDPQSAMWCRAVLFDHGWNFCRFPALSDRPMVAKASPPSNDRRASDVRARPAPLNCTAVPVVSEQADDHRIHPTELSVCRRLWKSAP
jgi:hypothetical protein